MTNQDGDGDNAPLTTEWKAKIVSEGRWDVEVLGRKVVVSLQSRPIAPGDWQDRWVWETEDGASARFFDTPDQACDNAYECFKAEDEEEKEITEVITVKITLNRTHSSATVSSIEVTDSEGTREASGVEQTYYDRDGARWIIKEGGAWILGTELVYF